MKNEEYFFLVFEMSLDWTEMEILNIFEKGRKRVNKL